MFTQIIEIIFSILINCTATQLAQYDGWQWNRTNALVLPSGGGSIVPNAANPATGPGRVTVSWYDNRAGADCAAVPAPAQCMSFVVEFIP